LPDGIAEFFSVHPEQLSRGLPKEQLLPVIEAIRKHVAAIRDAFAQLEIRMVGGSLLIIYEDKRTMMTRMWKRKARRTPSLV